MKGEAGRYGVEEEECQGSFDLPKFHIQIPSLSLAETEMTSEAPSQCQGQRAILEGGLNQGNRETYFRPQTLMQVIRPGLQAKFKHETQIH